jgi:uncharacterized protein (DUF486 family)
LVAQFLYFDIKLKLSNSKLGKTITQIQQIKGEVELMTLLIYSGFFTFGGRGSVPFGGGKMH